MISLYLAYKSNRSQPKTATDLGELFIPEIYRIDDQLILESPSLPNTAIVGILFQLLDRFGNSVAALAA
jgi:hypothetical protein